MFKSQKSEVNWIDYPYYFMPILQTNPRYVSDGELLSSAILVGTFHLKLVKQNQDVLGGMIRGRVRVEVGISGSISVSAKLTGPPNFL